MHCNLVNNNYQQASKLLFTFVPNTQFGQLINIAPHSLTMLQNFYLLKCGLVIRIKGYGFLSFARKFGDKYGKKLIDSATKTGINAAKTASKRVVQKTPEATGDLIGNKIADKITSLGKTKNKEKEEERQETYIPPGKRKEIIDEMRLF